MVITAKGADPAAAVADKLPNDWKWEALVN